MKYGKLALIIILGLSANMYMEGMRRGSGLGIDETKSTITSTIKNIQEQFNKSKSLSDYKSAQKQLQVFINSPKYSKLSNYSGLQTKFDTLKSNLSAKLHAGTQPAAPAATDVKPEEKFTASEIKEKIEGATIDSTFRKYLKLIKVNYASIKADSNFGAMIDAATTKGADDTSNDENNKVYVTDRDDNPNPALVDIALFLNSQGDKAKATLIFQRILNAQGQGMYTRETDGKTPPTITIAGKRFSGSFSSYIKAFSKNVLEKIPSTLLTQKTSGYLYNTETRAWEYPAITLKEHIVDFLQGAHRSGQAALTNKTTNKNAMKGVVTSLQPTFAFITNAEIGIN
jgi:hypothetical protein